MSILGTILVGVAISLISAAIIGGVALLRRRLAQPKAKGLRVVGSEPNDDHLWHEVKSLSDLDRYRR